MSILAAAPVHAQVSAEDSEAEYNNTKPTVMERAASDLPLYLCIGGGGAFVLVTICLLAEERKK